MAQVKDCLAPPQRRPSGLQLQDAALACKYNSRSEASRVCTAHPAQWELESSEAHVRLLNSHLTSDAAMQLTYSASADCGALALPSSGPDKLLLAQLLAQAASVHRRLQLSGPIAGIWTQSDG